MKYTKGRTPWNKGIGMSDETKKKVSSSIKAKWKDPEYRKKLEEIHSAKVGKLSSNWQGGKITITCEHCGQEFKVFPYRKDTAKYCSNSCLASAKTGENAKNWKGGIDLENKRARQSDEYDLWRKEVYRKFNWTCNICGKKCRGKDIIAHHIKHFSKYPKLRYDVNNGVTLCRSCHKKVHKEIGYATRFKPALTIA